MCVSGRLLPASTAIQCDEEVTIDGCGDLCYVFGSALAGACVASSRSRQSRRNYNLNSDDLCGRIGDLDRHMEMRCGLNQEGIERQRPIKLIGCDSKR